VKKYKRILSLRGAFFLGGRRYWHESDLIQMAEEKLRMEGIDVIF
jgi:hypothetical protein